MAIQLLFFSPFEHVCRVRDQPTPYALCLDPHHQPPAVVYIG